MRATRAPSNPLLTLTESRSPSTWINLAQAVCRKLEAQEGFLNIVKNRCQEETIAAAGTCCSSGVLTVSTA